MGLTLITQPTEEPLYPYEVKSSHKILGDDEDTAIQLLIVAARRMAEAKTGRQLLPATWELALDEFVDEVELPRPPARSITSVKYIDAAGVEQTLAPTVYELDTGVEPGILRLAYNQSWPTTRSQRNAVKIRYVAGYASRSEIPAEIVAWIDRFFGHIYENREMVITGTIVNDIPFLDDLLNPYRIFTVA